MAPYRGHQEIINCSLIIKQGNQSKLQFCTIGWTVSSYFEPTSKCKCHWILPTSLLSPRDCSSSEVPVPQLSRIPTLHLLPQSLRKAEWGPRFSALLSHSSACQTPSPWPTREWSFGKKVQVVWEICHLKQHLGLALLQGKLSAMTEESLVFLFTAYLVSECHFKPQLLFQTLYRANSYDSDQKYLLIVSSPYLTQFMWKKLTPTPRYRQCWCDISQML